MKQSTESGEGREAFYEAAPDRSYTPGKGDMEREVSVNVSPERLAQAVLKGGAPRREG